MSAASAAGPEGSASMPLGDLFAAGLARCPDRIAIADRKVSYSFRMLERLANRYAAVLARSYGVRAQDRVLVVCRKTCRVPALAVALWKLGAVYMPVDADLPPARLANIARRADPRLVVALEDLEVPDLTCVNIDAVADPADEVVPAYPHRDDDVAYVIHTSGSTGLPKGVQITARNLSRYFVAHNAMLRFRSGSRVMSFAPFHFDVSIEDTLLPLSLGAFVYQYNGPPIGDLMRRTLARERITHLIAVSTVLTVMSDRPEAITPNAFPDLEMVMTGAEVCAPSVINLWATRLPSARVYNVYGPTEVTVVCLGYHLASPEPGRAQPYPIGTPLDGVAVALLDGDGRDVRAPGDVGELCIGGDQVMAGYLAEPELTAGRVFVRDGIRFYRSGDRCRRDENGDYHFVGRVDAEVKINGRRINLAEIEAECLAEPAVARAAVGLIAAPGGRKVIGAVLVADDAAVVDVVRRRLLEQLPAYMLPSLWGLGSEVRLRSSGKMDERQLLSVLEATAGRDTQSTVIRLD